VEGQLTPAPGLADHDGLASAARSAGLAVDLEVRGCDTIPEGAALAVYRLVQEAVTNVVRHEPPPARSTSTSARARSVCG
jgi:signal transduction histidine kinase